RLESTLIFSAAVADCAGPASPIGGVMAISPTTTVRIRFGTFLLMVSSTLGPRGRIAAALSSLGAHAGEHRRRPERPAAGTVGERRPRLRRHLVRARFGPVADPLGEGGGQSRELIRRERERPGHVRRPA